jgi:hypothetical protein
MLVFSNFFASSCAPWISCDSRSARRFFSDSTCLRLARVTGADFDLIAFGAEAFDGFKQQNFAVCHGVNEFGLVFEL